MKPARVLAIAMLGYAAVLLPSASQASSVVLSAPGISVRLPAPPIPILLPPGVSIREDVGYDRGYGYGYRTPAPRYYHEDWRRERWEDHRHDDHHFRNDHDDHDDSRDHDHRDGGHR